MFIVITPESNLKNEAKTINKLFVAGLNCLHVRKPKMTKGELHKWITDINENFHNRCMLHQHHELALEFNLKGIHIKEKQRGEIKDLDRYTRYFQQENKCKSSGFHQLGEYKMLSQKFEYAFLSPVFNSVSKENYHGMEWDVSSLQQKPIALGGVTEKNIQETKKLGYGGIAVLGSVWNASNPVNAFLSLKNEYDEVYG
ncbi:thiamine phosphate synthase [Galbibacter sp. PAP.153]|uniref:thiamine phosphate synthase n=1 Tax=Galbibacter sp. PAP.153 TaxID=3104623 RepID=UPI003008E727